MNEGKMKMANKMLDAAIRKEADGDIEGADKWLDKAVAKEAEAFAGKPDPT